MSFSSVIAVQNMMGIDAVAGLDLRMLASWMPEISPIITSSSTVSGVNTITLCFKVEFQGFTKCFLVIHNKNPFAHTDNILWQRYL